MKQLIAFLLIVSVFAEQYDSSVPSTVLYDTFHKVYEWDSSDCTGCKFLALNSSYEPRFLSYGINNLGSVFYRNKQLYSNQISMIAPYYFNLVFQSCLDGTIIAQTFGQGAERLRVSVFNENLNVTIAGTTVNASIPITHHATLLSVTYSFRSFKVGIRVNGVTVASDVSVGSSFNPVDLTAPFTLGGDAVTPGWTGSINFFGLYGFPDPSINQTAIEEQLMTQWGI